MSGFFEEFMGSYNPFDSAGYDEQVIMRNSLFAVVPKIAKNAKMIIEKIGGYCILSIKKTNEQWEKLQ